MSFSHQVHATFTPNGRSVAAARSFVRGVLDEWDAAELVDDAVLLVSELVTNAIVHAGTSTEVRCLRYEDGVRIEICDQHPARELPNMSSGVAAEEDEGGRGLLLPAALASAWGVQYTPTTKQVWFQLDLPGRGGAREGTTLASPIVPAAVTPNTMDEVRVAVLRVDADGAVQHWNAQAVELFGWTAEQAAKLTLGDLVVLPRQSSAGLVLADVLKLSRWQGRCGVRHQDGRLIPVYASHVRTADAADVPSITGLYVLAEAAALLETPPAARPARPPAPTAQGDPDAEWAGLTHSVASRFGLDELLQRAVERARDALDGDAAYVLLVTDDETELEVRATTGLPVSVHRGPRVPATGMGGRIGSSRLPTVHDDLGARCEAMPVLAGTGMRSLLTVPLLVEGRVTGTLGVAAAKRGRFGNEDAIRLQRAADRIALSVESARLAELERSRRGSLSFLAEASDLLAGILDNDMTLAMVAQLVVPRLATWCAVHTVDDAGEPRLSYVWHENEDHIDPLRQLLERATPPEMRALPGARPWTGLAAPGDAAGDTVVRSGGSALPVRNAAALVGATAISLPLVARGRGLGTLTLGRPSGDRFRRDLVELAEDLSRRAALAMDNARLYSDRAATSQALQRSLLPPELPEVPGVEVGVVYQAAGEGNEVGGDFYDLFEMRENCWGLAIGDVCGTGPEAAAVTGLARHSLHILAREGQPVPAVLERLNTAILDEGARGRFMTLLYGELMPRPEGGVRLTFASAGHPLPLLLRAGGGVAPVGTPQPLLGVMDTLDLVEESVDLDPGDVLVAVTDGVTERREGARMLGEDGLATVLAGCRELTAGAVAARIQRAVVDFAVAAPRDDMAILALRVC